MATAFPSTEEVKVYLREDRSEDDALYDEALAAAIQTLNDLCQRTFVVAGTPTARTFVPDRYTDSMYIGDHTSVTSIVENGATLTVGNHYQLEPVNPYNAAGIQFPYTLIRRLSDRWWYRDRYLGTVVVTAAWGWPAIPARVVEAVKIMTKDIIENRASRGGLLTFGDVGLATARTNPFVGSVIDTYRSRESWGIA